MKQPIEVLVIGGGIIGLSTAYYLVKQGYSVTVVEKDEVCAGSSHGNAGLIANGFAIPLPGPGVISQGLKWMLDPEGPFYLKPRLNGDLIRWLWRFRAACTEEWMRQTIPILLNLGQGSFELFDKLQADEEMAFGYEKKGRLILFTSERSFNKRAVSVALMREFGVEMTLLDDKGLRQIEPNVLPAVKYGVYCADYGHVIPHRLVHELTRVVLEKGVRLQTGLTVQGFETSGQRVASVVTNRGRCEADQIVLAAGAWSAQIARQLKLRMLIQPAKGYSITVKAPNTAPRLPLSLAEREVAVTPMGDALRLTSTLEMVGFDRSVSQRRIASIRHAADEYLPGMASLEEREIWSGYRPLTPDDLPIIGRSRMFKNLVLATGHGKLGMTQGLITGKLVSQIIAGEQPAIDLAPFKPDRFAKWRP
jgi:D-amino-acid dehydrogenase